MAVPVAIAARSPLLQWRDATYIAAGFAGIVAMALLLVQPLLPSGRLPGLAPFGGRRWHRWVGTTVVLLVVLHVAGLWLTSPPDVVDALLLRSPTPFSVWGVAAMWAVLLLALVAGLRRRLRPRLWRLVHAGLVVVVVGGTVVHALLIEGAMGTVSKVVLAVLVVAASAWASADLLRRPGRSRARRAGRRSYAPAVRPVSSEP